MFTGLVRATGEVMQAERTPGGRRLAIETGDLAGELAEGDSVAVNGVCLTATGIDGPIFWADVMAETLDRSSLGPVADGDRVNLELPLRASDRLGGHIVQGHVDGVGEVRSVTEDGFARLLEVAVKPRLLRYVVEKGSIAIDGVSLTVAALRADSFTVSLIPETLERTTLGLAGRGRAVNVEVDVIAKYVEKLASHTVVAP
ncbi:MAG: riboflavin synthase [Thermoleophilaceae bacterium]